MLSEITKELNELNERNNQALAMMDELNEMQDELESTMGDIYLRAMELEEKRRNYFCSCCPHKEGAANEI